MQLHDDDHGRGFPRDLSMMNAMVQRRRALRWFAGAGPMAFVAGCAGGESSSSEITVVDGIAATPKPTPAATATSTPTPTPTSSVRTACCDDPTETNGTYPADGTNSSSGLTFNAITATGVVRSDIRSSFLGSSTVAAAGVPVTLTITVVNVKATCGPLSGFAVHLDVRRTRAVSALRSAARRLSTRRAAFRRERTGNFHRNCAGLLRRTLSSHSF